MGELDLSDRDVQAMLHIASRYCAVEDVGQPLPWELLHDLRDLIACDALSASGQDDPAHAFFADQTLCDDTSGADQVSDDAYWTHYWDCLACSYPGHSGDLVSVTMESDFYSERALHDTGMYVDYLRPNGIEHEMMLCLPSGPGRTLRLLFFRGKGAGFTERDRALLTLLRPHLNAAYVAVERKRQGQLPLTPRQNEILLHVAAGLSNGQIARRLSVSEATVRKHLENVFARLNVTSRTAAVGRAGIEPFNG
jgi:DNA-binding CsgD family transcriptional regulator